MTTERIDIVINEDGSRTVKRNLSDLGDTAESVAGSFDILKDAILGMFAVFSFQKFAQMTSVWTDLNARVNRFAGSVQGTNKVMDRLLSIAQRTYAPMEGISEIFLENAFALEQMGKSTEETLDYTEALTNALVVSGAKGDRQRSVISALSKAMLEGKLAGDNWNTVLTTGGRVVEALVQETGKSLAELKQMASAGQLSGDTVFTALLNQLEKLREEADEMPATIGDAFVRLQNQILKTVGTMDEKLGLSSTIVKGIDWITQNLEELIPVVAGLGAAIITAFAPGYIMRFTGAIKTLFALLRMHPFMFLASAIAGIITYLTLLRDEIKLGIDDTTTLGDLMRAVWEQITPVIKAVADVIAQFFGWLTQTSAGSFGELLDHINGYEHQNEATWLKVLRAAAKTFDAIGAVVRATFLAAGRTVGIWAAATVQQFLNVGDVFKKVMSGDFSGAAEAVANAMDYGKQALKDLGAVWVDTFNEEFAAQASGGLEKWLDDTIARAQEIGKGRQEGGFEGFKNQGGVAPPMIDPNAAKEAKKLADALDALLNKINPIRAAQQELKQAEELLAKARAAGLITLEASNAAYAKLKEQLREQLEPYEYMIEQMKVEHELAKLLGKQREIEIELKDRVNQLTRAGVNVTREMTDELRAQLVVQQQLDEIGRAKEFMLQNSNASMLESFEVTAKGMRQLIDDATSGFTSGDIAVAIVNAFGQIVDGTSIAVEANLQQWEYMYAQLDILREQDLISEEQASEIRKAIKKQEMDMYLQMTSNALNTAAGLMRSQNKKAFKIGQTAAIAETVMNTYASATAAYKSAANIPYVGWILAPAAAAGAIAAGMAQVSAIRSQQPPAYRTGGTYTVGGYGGVDSQLVAFRATPGEQVSINTPAQANAMHNIEQLLREDRQQRGRGGITQNLTIVQQGKPNNKTPEQEARAMFKAGRKLVKVRG